MTQPTVSTDVLRVPAGPALIALCGPPGAGKSTRAEHLVQELAAHRPTSPVLLSLDACRAQLSPYGDETDQAVTAAAVTWMFTELRRHLDAGSTVVLDATSAEREHREALLASAAAHGAYTALVVLLPDLLTCQQRNARRDRAVGACGYTRRVPGRTVAAMHRQICADLLILSVEGWDQITFPGTPEPVVPEQLVPAGSRWSR